MIKADLSSAIQAQIIKNKKQKKEEMKPELDGLWKEQKK